MHVETPSAADLEELFDLYFGHGCPCRFPRFRAMAALDLKEVGAWDWGVSDVGDLLEVFDRRVRVLENTREDFAMRGQCELCGATVVRFGIPVFRDSFLERAHITPGALPDVGAAADWPLPICGHVFHAGPGNVTRNEKERIQSAYPRLQPRDWLAYMAELAR
jgi:hypothetical protein